MARVKHYFEEDHFYHLTTRTREGVFAFDSEGAKRVVVWLSSSIAGEAIGGYTGLLSWPTTCIWWFRPQERTFRRPSAILRSMCSINWADLSRADFGMPV